MSVNKVSPRQYANVERSVEVREMLVKVHELGINYSKIAEFIGIHKVYLSRFMNGHLNYSDNMLDRVEAALEKYKVLL